MRCRFELLKHFLAVLIALRHTGDRLQGETVSWSVHSNTTTCLERQVIPNLWYAEKWAKPVLLECEYDSYN